MDVLACISFLVPLAPGWIIFSKTGPELRLLILTLTLQALFAAAGFYTGIHFIRNLGLYFAAYVSSFYLYSLLFRRLLATPLARALTSGLMLGFGIFVIVRLPAILRPGNFDSYTPAALSVAMMTYSVLFFNRQLALPQITFIYKTPWFWIVTGLLLYYAGSFLILLTTDYLMVRDNPFIWGLWDLMDVLTIVQNLLIALGFLFYKQTAWNISS